MNIRSFLEHWRIRRDPFLDEEARHDEVFLRQLEDPFEHFELPKIAGDLAHPSSAVVFGEKGSGKTAIRMQLAARIARHNREQPDRQALVVAYDDLNPVLDRFARRVPRKTPLETLRALTLNDHVDAILATAVPKLVDRAIAPRGGHVADHELDDATPLPRRALRRQDRDTKRDWMLLQALYDRPEGALARAKALRRRLGVHGFGSVRPRRWLAGVLWGLLVAAIVWIGFFEPPGPAWAVKTGLGILAALTIAVTAVAVTDFVRVRTLAVRLAKQLRVLDHPVPASRRVLERLPRFALDAPFLPVDDLDEPRYEMLQRLRRAVRAFGVTSVLVLLDRVDEPTLVNGDEERMKAVVWPLLNNKLLQAPGFAIKMMLPLELRYAVFAGSKDFFQSARLDKQNMIDRLQWSGATLYDLCNRRLRACTEEGAEPPSLRDLFDEGTTREDLVAALDQMRQPRDAFKLLHQIVQRHCATTTEEEEQWRISGHVIDEVLERQKERLDALRSGLAPA